MSDIFNLTLEDKLYRTRYEADPDNPHIKVSRELCARCDEKPCLFICPAGVYKESPEDPNLIIVSHENCLECGTCRRICPEKAIEWRFPEGGMGVKYRFG